MPELHYDDQSWRALARKLPAIAPTYFVSGNHEWWKGNFEEVEAELMKFGIQVLRNKTISLVANGRAINITGVDDPEAWKGDNKIYLQFLYGSISAMTIGVMIMAIISFQSKFFHIFQQLQLINDQLFNTNTQLQTTITQLTKETEQKEAALIREQKKTKKINLQSTKIKAQLKEIPEYSF